MTTTTHATPGATGRQAPDELGRAHEAFRDELLGAGLLVGSGLDGLYARGAGFERVTAGVRRAIAAAGHEVHGDTATTLRFPPIYPRAAYEKTDYIASFPNLTGVLFTFEGADREHRALLADRDAGMPWDHHLGAGETVMVSAACHPSYSTLAGTTLPDGGATLDVEGWCFRKEPSPDPLRMQMFVMSEYVRVGSTEQVATHLASWLEVAVGLLRSLGLAPRDVPANDPFFGRAGRMLATNQRHQSLKTELVVPLYGDLDEGTALFSANNHLDHFGAPFDIRTRDGQTAHSSCVGFGVDRITLALLRIHGFEVDSWPTAVQARLGEQPSTGTSP